MGPHTRLLSFLALMMSVYLRVAFAYCPSAQSLSPCTCDHFGINCMNARSTDDLSRAFRSGNSTNRDHNELWIQKTPVRSFPRTVLGSFRFAEIHVDLNTNLTSFTLDSLAGCSSELRVLSLYKNQLRTFEFAKVSAFPSLGTLNLGGNQLASIPDDAFRSRSIRTLVLSENPIISISQRAFTNLYGLRDLRLDNTRLVTLGRHSMAIPWADRQLRINLSNGNIVRIDGDAFSGTSPLLLQLANNNMTTLDGDVFPALIQSMINNARALNTLPLITLHGNRFSCRGCSYQWMVQNRYSRVLDNILEGFRCTDGGGLQSMSATKVACRTPWSFNTIG
ncbi:uncharacterized protein LOC144159604 [Haemaphysalis longicornis]